MLEELSGHLRRLGRFAVAFSGGVDSSLLCAAAARATVVRFVALTVDTPFTFREDLDRARDLASMLGFAHCIVSVDPLSDPAIASNPADRCYLCKRMIFRILIEAASREGLTLLTDGTNSDDMKEDRPGLRALLELGVRSPLAELGIGRGEVVEMSTAMGLPSPGRRNTACLATRIPTGVAIRHELLTLVERLEGKVQALGYSFARVRTDGREARVELLPEELGRESPEAEVTRLMISAGLVPSGIFPYGGGSSWSRCRGLG